MELRFHSAARTEMFDAIRWYAERSERAKDGFLDELAFAVSRMREAPLRWPVYLHGTRRARLRRFPFAIVYHLGIEVLHVVAIAHLHRRPGYWRDRVAE